MNSSHLTFRPYTPSSADNQYKDLLPHRSRAGSTVFVTWRLSDGLPPLAEMEQSVRKAQKRWLEREKLSYCPWTQPVEDIVVQHYPEKSSQFRMIRFRVQEYFDKRNRGSCALRHRNAIDSIQKAVDEEEKWGLGIGDGVVCFNHVHILVVLGSDGSLKSHMERIKGRASRYLGLAEIPELPKPIWQRYWFDHLVRDSSKLNRIRKYISNHPLPCWEAYRSVEWTCSK